MWLLLLKKGSLRTDG